MPDLSTLFDLSRSVPAALFSGGRLSDDFAEKLPERIVALGLALSDEYEEIAEDVWVGSGTVIASSARISGPALIGKGVEIRHAAVIRGGVVVGDGAVIGNATELFLAVLFEGVVLPGRNSVRGGIVGKGVAFGSGAVLGSGPWGVEGTPGGGAASLVLVGDGCVIGENAVLGAGASLGKKCIVEPLALVRGEIPPGRRVLRDGEIRSIR